MNSLPEYLRLHIEEESAPKFLVENSDSICQQFESATGWQYFFGPSRSSNSSSNPSEFESGTFEVIDLSENVDENHRPILRDSAEKSRQRQINLSANLNNPIERFAGCMPIWQLTSPSSNEKTIPAAQSYWIRC